MRNENAAGKLKIYPRSVKIEKRASRRRSTTRNRDAASITYVQHKPQAADWRMCEYLVTCYVCLAEIRHAQVRNYRGRALLIKRNATLFPAEAR